MNIINEAKRVFDIEISALEKTRDSLDGDFEAILRAVISCTGKVIITGMGKPGHIGEKLAATFSSLGTPSFFLHPAEAMHGDLGMVAKDDVVIAISFSGESDEIVKILPTIKLIGAKLIGITGNGNSTLAEASDIVQVLPDFEEACYLGLAPTSSTTVALCYGDALAVVASGVYGFKDADFGKFHPAGALGKKLIYRVNDLMDEGQNTYGRVDKAAANLLLARLYLNAQVYTGEPRWQDAMTYAEKVINSSYYHLNNQKTAQYSAYQMLFLADNNENGAQYEMVFPVLLDGIQTQSYDASNFLVFSNYGEKESNAAPSGTNNSWGKCARVKGKLVEKFFGNEEAPQTEDLAVMTRAANDDRALFYSMGYTQYITTEAADEGFTCLKFRNVRSDGKAASAINFVDTDLPLLRVAEAYLTYAEASIRLNGQNATATKYINELRKRANAEQIPSCTIEDVFDEWSREFWFEGRRRMDLVRYGRFGGQSDYRWEFMNNVPDGGAFSSNYNVYGLPSTDLDTNTNLKQNPGY